jgi:hypothetical protein
MLGSSGSGRRLRRAPRQGDQQVCVFGVDWMDALAFEASARKPFAQRRDRIRRAGGAQRVEVFDDDRAAAVLQRARDLAERRCRPLRRREHAIRCDRIEQRSRERQVVHVAALQFAMTEPRSVHVGARQPQSVAGNIDADGAGRVRGEQPEQMSRAGSHVEEHTDRCVGELAEDDRIDRARSRAARCHRQLIGGASCAFANDRFHAFAVTTQQVVVLADEREKLLDRAPLRAGRRRAVVDPVLLAKTIEQSGVAHELEVARDPRLALTHDLADLADRQLRPREQREQPQPRRFSSSAERGDSGQECSRHRCSLCNSGYKDVLIFDRTVSRKAAESSRRIAGVPTL